MSADFTIFSYALRGTLVAPAGTTLINTGLRLPDGDILKVWEQFELHPADGSDPVDLTFDELSKMGCFYDGDMAQIEGPE